MYPGKRLLQLVRVKKFNFAAAHFRRHQLHLKNLFLWRVYKCYALGKFAKAQDVFHVCGSTFRCPAFKFRAVVKKDTHPAVFFVPAFHFRHAMRKIILTRDHAMQPDAQDFVIGFRH